MKKTIKRLFSRAALTLTLLLLTSVAAWAAPTSNWHTWVRSQDIDWTDAEARAAVIPQSEDGSTVYISTAEQLAYYAYAVNTDKKTSGSAAGYYCGRTVELLADIDISARYWIPIGRNTGYGFNGFFHGNGHVISGMYIDTTQENGYSFGGIHEANIRIGLFGTMNGRKEGNTDCITNLILKDFYITPDYIGYMNDYYIGCLVGVCNNGTISNCLMINGTVNTDSYNSSYQIGGLVGKLNAGEMSNNYRYNVNLTTSSTDFITTDGESLAHNVKTSVAGANATSTTGISYGGKFYTSVGAAITLSGVTVPAGYAYGVNNSPIASNTFAMPDADVIIDIKPDPAHFSDDGNDNYTIHSAEGWGVFCDLIDEGTTFSGKTVTLANNITVSRIAGSGNGSGLTASDRPFCGTFLGGGKTLTFNYGSSGTPADENNIAPFRYVNNATISGLHVAGDIYTKHVHCGGIVGMAYGTTNITDCRSSVNIHSSINGDGTHGGIMSCSWTGSTTNIKGCLFDGSIQSATGYTTDQCGGFVGWRNATINVKNCLLTADLSTIVNPDGLQYPSATFVRNGNANTITNSYYLTALGTAQGKASLSVTAGENVTTEAVSPVGDATATYSVSGITAYAKGITRGTTFYYGQDDDVSLTLGNTTPRGYTLSGYEASNGGTLSGNETDGYTLTMPNDNVTISALFTPIDLSKLMDIVLGKAEATDVYDVNGDKQFNILDVAKLIDILVNVSQ